MKKARSNKNISELIKLYNSESGNYKRVEDILLYLKNYEFKSKECDKIFRNILEPYVNEFKRLAHDDSICIDKVEDVADDIIIKLLKAYADEKKIVLKKEIRGLERKIDRKMGLNGLKLKGKKIKSEEPVSKESIKGKQENGKNN